MRIKSRYRPNVVFFFDRSNSWFGGKDRIFPLSIGSRSARSDSPFLDPKRPGAGLACAARSIGVATTVRSLGSVAILLALAAGSRPVMASSHRGGKRDGPPDATAGALCKGASRQLRIGSKSVMKSRWRRSTSAQEPDQPGP